MSQTSDRLPAAVFVVPIAMLAIALMPLPYGYYQLLRLVVCGCAAWAVFTNGDRERWAWATVFALMALTYNPVFRVHLTREIWSVVNLLTILIFATGWWAERRNRRVEDRDAERSAR